MQIEITVEKKKHTITIPDKLAERFEKALMYPVGESDITNYIGVAFFNEGISMEKAFEKYDDKTISKRMLSVIEQEIKEYEESDITW